MGRVSIRPLGITVASRSMMTVPSSSTGLSLSGARRALSWSGSTLGGGGAWPPPTPRGRIGGLPAAPRLHPSTMTYNRPAHPDAESGREDRNADDADDGGEEAEEDRHGPVAADGDAVGRKLHRELAVPAALVVGGLDDDVDVAVLGIERRRHLGRHRRLGGRRSRGWLGR